MEFLVCENPADLKGNKTRDDSGSGGCCKVEYHYYKLFK